MSVASPALPIQLPAEWLESPLLIETYEALARTVAEERTKRLQFYHDITPEVKWEFINGEVVMHSPALHRHTRVVQNLFKLLDAHCQKTGIGMVCLEKALCTFPRNDYEPDIVFFGLAKSAVIGPDTLRYPIPDFVVEVLSPATKKNDRGVKKEDYAAHGVAEYWIVDPGEESVEQYLAVEGAYPDTAPPLGTGIIISSAVAGFRLPVRAIFDAGENWKALRELLVDAP